MTLPTVILTQGNYFLACTFGKHNFFFTGEYLTEKTEIHVLSYHTSTYTLIIELLAFPIVIIILVVTSPTRRLWE